MKQRYRIAQNAYYQKFRHCWHWNLICGKCSNKANDHIFKKNKKTKNWDREQSWMKTSLDRDDSQAQKTIQNRGKQHNKKHRSIEDTKRYDKLTREQQPWLDASSVISVFFTLLSSSSLYNTITMIPAFDCTYSKTPMMSLTKHSNFFVPRHTWQLCFRSNCK